jgi:hypothetical protein
MHLCKETRIIQLLKSIMFEPKKKRAILAEWGMHFPESRTEKRSYWNGLKRVEWKYQANDGRGQLCYLFSAARAKGLVEYDPKTRKWSLGMNAAPYLAWIGEKAYGAQAFTMKNLGAGLTGPSYTPGRHTGKEAAEALKDDPAFIGFSSFGLPRETRGLRPSENSVPSKKSIPNFMFCPKCLGNFIAGVKWTGESKEYYRIVDGKVSSSEEDVTKTPTNWAVECELCGYIEKDEKRVDHVAQWYLDNE